MVLPVSLDSFALATDTLEQMLEACECSEDTELFRDCGSTLGVSSPGPSALLQSLDFSMVGIPTIEKSNDCSSADGGGRDYHVNAMFREREREREKEREVLIMNDFV